MMLFFFFAFQIIGKFSQNDIDSLPSEESPLQYLCEEAEDQKTFRPKAVKKLMGLGLPNNCHSTKMEELTVNEKALVVLAKFCLYPHDVLLLVMLDTKWCESAL